MAILLFTDESAVSTDFKGFADTYFQIFKDLHEYYKSGFAQRVICRLSANVSRIREVVEEVRIEPLLPLFSFLCQCSKFLPHNTKKENADYFKKSVDNFNGYDIIISPREQMFFCELNLILC